MEIVAISVIFLCLVDPISGQSEEDSETKVMGDSGWWSRRITKINREGGQRIGLASKDNQRHAGRREEGTVIRDSRRRPRPFASLLPSNAETRFQDSIESQGEKFRNGKEALIAVDLNAFPTPSPILLPPLATPSPVYLSNIFEKTPTTLQSNNESSLNTGKSSTSPALERIRIYEITTSNSTQNVAFEGEPSHVDESLKTLKTNDNKESHWINFVWDAQLNRTMQRNDVDELSPEGIVQNNLRSFYIDEGPRKERILSSKTASNRSNLIKSPRGNRKYQDDFPDRKAFPRRRTYSGPRKNDWRRRSGQRSNHFGYNIDTANEAGSVPGVPGLDYPIHQEHTHHHLRNLADRFPCPRTPKTHVYLADRASRCQIFYVCYGSRTGVPMVCPNGTLFSEPLQVCDWWYNVPC